MYEIHYMEPDASKSLATLFQSSSYDITETVFDQMIKTAHDTTVLGVYNTDADRYIGGVMHTKVFAMQHTDAAK